MPMNPWDAYQRPSAGVRGGRQLASGNALVPVNQPPVLLARWQGEPRVCVVSVSARGQMRKDTGALNQVVPMSAHWFFGLGEPVTTRYVVDYGCGGVLSRVYLDPGQNVVLPVCDSVSVSSVFLYPSGVAYPAGSTAQMSASISDADGLGMASQPAACSAVLGGFAVGAYSILYPSDVKQGVVSLSCAQTGAVGDVVSWLNDFYVMASHDGAGNSLGNPLQFFGELPVGVPVANMAVATLGVVGVARLYQFL